MMENPVSILLIHITVRKSGCNHHLAVCQKCKIASLRVLKAQLVNITIKINTVGFFYCFISSSGFSP